MSDNTTLPVHPVTGLRAIGIGKRGPIWPVLGGSEDGGHPALGGPDGSETETGGTEHQKSDQLPDDHPLVKALAAQKAELKDLRPKAKRLDDLEESTKSEAERAADRIAKAEAEVAGVPTKVAEGLKAHLVSRNGIAAEDAELFLTATDPELLLKQVDRLLGQSGKRRKNNNYVPDQGNADKSETPGGMRDFTRQLFGNDT